MRDTSQVANTTKNAATALPGNSLHTVKMGLFDLNGACNINRKGTGRKKLIASQVSNRLRSVRPHTGTFGAGVSVLLGSDALILERQYSSVSAHRAARNRPPASE